MLRQIQSTNCAAILRGGLLNLTSIMSVMKLRCSLLAETQDFYYQPTDLKLSEEYALTQPIGESGGLERLARLVPTSLIPSSNTGIKGGRSYCVPLRYTSELECGIFSTG